jgi:lysozyme
MGAIQFGRDGLGGPQELRTALTVDVVLTAPASPDPPAAPRGRGRRLRWIALTVTALLVLAVLAAVVAWKVGLPQYRPSLKSGEVYGLDVSHHQGQIDWRKVAADDISFAYVKATEGGDFVDSRFVENRDAATAARVAIGAYHFLTFCSSGAEQAENFLRVAPPDAAMLPPAVDIEYGGNCAARPSKDAFHAEVATFLDRVETAWGREAIVYVLHDTEADYAINAKFNRKQWQRRLVKRPNWDGWALWQVSGRSAVDGVHGPVDLNVGKVSIFPDPA